MTKIRVNVGESSFEVAQGQTLVGRGPDCQVRLSDASVSRHHLAISVSDDGVIVEDLESTNGTCINGALLTGRCLLADGDMLELGDCFVGVSIDQQTEAGHSAKPRKSPRDTLVIPNAAVDAWAQRRPKASQGLIRRDTGPIRTKETVDISARRVDPRERRRHARMNAGTRVRYDSDSLNFDAIAEDVSDGGVFVVTELLDQVGTSCEMTIELQGTRPFMAHGVVRHVVVSKQRADAHPPGMGIEFTELQGFSSP